MFEFLPPRIIYFGFLPALAFFVCDPRNSCNLFAGISGMRKDSWALKSEWIYRRVGVANQIIRPSLEMRHLTPHVWSGAGLCWLVQSFRWVPALPYAAHTRTRHLESQTCSPIKIHCPRRIAPFFIWRDTLIKWQFPSRQIFDCEDVHPQFMWWQSLNFAFDDMGLPHFPSPPILCIYIFNFERTCFLLTYILL